MNTDTTKQTDGRTPDLINEIEEKIKDLESEGHTRLNSITLFRLYTLLADKKHELFRKEQADAGTAKHLVTWHKLEQLQADLERAQTANNELLAALKAWERARKDGGISHADLYEAAWKKTQATIAKAEKEQQ